MDLDAPSGPLHLPGPLIYTVPPPRSGPRDTRLQNLLAQLDPPPAAIVYLSTSGVYGDCGGDWVDEQRAAAPLTDRARRRLDAEQQIADYATAQGIRHAILRVPGIYGPGRLPIERLQAGTPILDPAESPWSNRIHAADLAAACHLAADKGQGVYNISDGTPGRMSEYFLALADALGLPPPPRIGMAQAEREFSTQRLSFLRESRRLIIDRARRELAYAPRYPSLAEGLPASLPA